MIKENINLEVQNLKRNKTLMIFSIAMFLIILFSSYNGQQKVNSRMNDLTAMKQELNDYDKRLKEKFKAVENGEKIQRPWELNVSYIARVRGALTAMPAKEYSFIAIGQSDIFANQKKVTSFGKDFAVDMTELTNPTQLFFGNFDLSFVIIYLLPLLIIAYSYNIVSSERERGSLTLVLSQPISALSWLYQKILIRFSILILVVFISLTLSFLFFNKLSLSQDFWYILFLSFLYVLFWFSISLIVNLWRSSSSVNAFSLLTIWILITFIIPSIINNYSNYLYPVPSRILLISEMRAKQAELNKVQDKTLKEYLKDHPELISDEKNKKYGFYEKYFASKKRLKKELSSSINQYQDQIRERDQLIETLSMISPAILLQDAFQAIAGTSSKNYHNYRDQYMAFSEQWVDFSLPYLFGKKKFQSENIADLPKFEYKEELGIDSIITFLTTTFLFISLIFLSQIPLSLKKERKGALLF